MRRRRGRAARCGVRGSWSYCRAATRPPLVAHITKPGAEDCSCNRAFPTVPGSCAPRPYPASEAAMKRWLAALLVLAAPAVFPQQPVPVIAFESVPNLLKLPKDMHLGEVTGVAVNSKGNIYVFSRGNTTGPPHSAAPAPPLEVAPPGRVLPQIGKNLSPGSFPPSGRVD